MPTRPSSSTAKSASAGSGHLLPWRFTLFLALCMTALPLAGVLHPALAVMAGFDAAALLFLVSIAPLLRHGEDRMRTHARANNANRVVMLLIVSIVLLVLLVVVASELTQRHEKPTVAVTALILGTLAIAWIFSNIVYALHYAYLFYSADAGGKDMAGIDFPGTGKPDYWDFIYFSFTLGMTFQTSDVDIPSRTVRRAVTFHCLAAFVFNLGIIAFTINVLGAG